MDRISLWPPVLEILSKSFLRTGTKGRKDCGIYGDGEVQGGVHDWMISEESAG
jgi:hypothetical protein